MATVDRYDQRLECACGAVVELLIVDRAYNVADPGIERVVGPAIKRVHKAVAAFGLDHVDILCGRCGTTLYESTLARKYRLNAPRDASEPQDARKRRVADKPVNFLHGR